MERSCGGQVPRCRWVCERGRTGSARVRELREAGQALGRRSACTDAPVPASASEIVHPVGRQRGNRRKFGTGGSESSHHGPVMAPEPPRPFHRGIPALRPRKISATVSADTVGHGYASCRVGRKDWLPGAMLDSGDLGDPRWRRREPRTKLYWRGQGAGENSCRKFQGRSCSDQPRFDPPLASIPNRVSECDTL